MQGRFFRNIVSLREQSCNTPALPFSEVLTDERIGQALRDLNCTWRNRLWTPCVTLWTFLWQVLGKDHSCRDAVARLLAFRAARGLPPCSSRTGHYCEARQRLPQELLSHLLRSTGRELSAQAPQAWRVAGRPVKLIDGSTVSMPDTPENAAQFGKPSNQKKKAQLFPVARLVAVLCLQTGAALELALGPYRGKGTGELSLFRSLPKDTFAPGDILLGDRLYCTWCDLARLLQQGVDAVVRLHAQRTADFRRGRRLGKEDHLVRWRKPARCPEWLSPAEFAALPDELELRELRVRVAVPGFRAKSLVVVTTLLDAETFSRATLESLYRQRWHAELDLRSIKTALGMDVLRCQTPDMVRKEVWMHLLAYNLLRSVMCAAAQEHDVGVRQLSFTGTQQLLGAFQQLLLTASAAAASGLLDTLLSAVAEHRVGHRPNRVEPRKRKRQAKPYPPLKQPRRAERKLLL